MEIVNLRNFYVEYLHCDGSDSQCLENDFDQTPKEAIKFFKDFAMRSFYLDAYGNDIFVPDLTSLSEVQHGYAYNPVLKEKIEGWPESWTVVACQGSTPFVFDPNLRRVGSCILDSKRRWRPFFVFEDLVSFFWVLGVTAFVIKDEVNLTEGISSEGVMRAKKILSANNIECKVDLCLRSLYWL